jgi:hypothetical protein
MSKFIRMNYKPGDFLTLPRSAAPGRDLRADVAVAVLPYILLFSILASLFSTKGWLSSIMRLFAIRI